MTAHSSHKGIDIPPQSVNISLNGVATLNCTAIANFINWKVNGTPVDDLRQQGIESFDNKIRNEELGKNRHIARLRVKGSSNSNHAMVTCVAVLTKGVDISSVFSKPALILVQG